MLSLALRASALTIVCALLVTIGRVFGHGSPGGGQIAYSYSESNYGFRSTILEDTHHHLRSPLFRAYESVTLIGWIDSERVLVLLSTAPNHYGLLNIGTLRLEESTQRDWQVAAPDETTEGWAEVAAQGTNLKPAPDGAQLALMRLSQGLYTLYVLDRDGVEHRLTREAGVFGLNYVWRPCREAGC